MNDEMQEILCDFLAESSEMLEALDQHFVKLEAEPTNAELLNEIFRCMHSMKGSAGFLGFTHLVEVAHQGESLLNKVRQGEIGVSPFIIDIILEAVDAVKLLHADIRETGEDSHVDTALIVNKLTLTMDSADDLNDVMPSAPKVKISSSVPEPPIQEKPLALATQPLDVPAPPLKKVNEGQEDEASLSVSDAEEAESVAEGQTALSEMLSKMQEAATRTVQAAASGPAKIPGKEEETTVRVETRRLDHVMNLVGELVLGRNRLMKLGLGLEDQFETNPLVRELGVTLAQLNLVTSDLQLAVMKTRMVPIYVDQEQSHMEPVYGPVEKTRLAGSPEGSLRTLFVRYAYLLVPVGLMAWVAFSVPLVMVNGTYILATASDDATAHSSTQLRLKSRLIRHLHR